jgi:Domain of unknown function (DUF4440)
MMVSFGRGVFYGSKLFGIRMELDLPSVRIHPGGIMYKLFALLPFALGAIQAQIQPLESIKSQEELNKAVTALDAALFDSYNRCDLEKFASFFIDDVEFYHDQGGVTLGKKDLADSVKKNICGKVTRELVPGTLQVFHMKGFGAVEMGFTVSTTRGMTTPSHWARAGSFTCGNTKTGRGKSPGSSATTTMRFRNRAD